MPEGSLEVMSNYQKPEWAKVPVWQEFLTLELEHYGLCERGTWTIGRAGIARIRWETDAERGATIWTIDGQIFFAAHDEAKKLKQWVETTLVGCL